MLRVAVALGAAFGAGLGLGSMLMVREGALKQPEVITVTRWTHPPDCPPPPQPTTPLTPAEQHHLDWVKATP